MSAGFDHIILVWYDHNGLPLVEGTIKKLNDFAIHNGARMHFKYDSGLTDFVFKERIKDLSLSEFLHDVYSIMAGNCWLMMPFYLIIFSSRAVYSRGEKINLLNALRMIANTSISTFSIFNDLNELEEFVFDYPGSNRKLFSSSDIVRSTWHWGNLIRLHSVNFYKQWLLSTNVNGVLRNLLVSGLHPFLYSALIQSGVNFKMLEIDDKNIPRDFQFDFKIHSSNLQDTISYNPPSELKLVWLHDLMFSMVYSKIIYIGAAPGLTLIDKSYKFEPTCVILIDPKFKNVYKSYAKQLSNKYYTIKDVKFNYNVDEDASEYDIHDEDNLLFVDDAYILDNQFRFTMMKLKYYARVIGMREVRGLNTRVLLKFNPKFTQKRKSVVIPYLQDVILQPGVNDSTEIRLLLSSCGSEIRLFDTTFYGNVSRWRTISLHDQFNASLYYLYKYGKYIYIGDVFNKLLMEPNNDYLMLFSISNVKNGDRELVISNLRNIMEFSAKHDTFALFNVPSLFYDAPTDALDDDSVTVRRTDYNIQINYFSKKFSDWMFSLIDFDFRTTTDLLYQHIINFSDNVGFAIDTIPFISYVFTFYVSNSVSKLFLPQTGLTSPGPIIKAYTNMFRIKNHVNPKTTYQSRMHLFFHLTDANPIDFILLGNRTSTFKTLKDTFLTVKDGPLSGKRIFLKKDEIVNVSGHMLNMLIALNNGFSQIYLWIKQWHFQQQKLFDGDNVMLARALRYYNNLNLLFDYNPDDDLLDSWHSKNDILIALIISVLYVTRIDYNKFDANHFNNLILHLFDIVDAL